MALQGLCEKLRWLVGLYLRLQALRQAGHGSFLGHSTLQGHLHHRTPTLDLGPVAKTLYSQVSGQQDLTRGVKI